MVETFTERKRAALRLFAPLGSTYDRYARLLSFGQDARWRRFLVTRVEASSGDLVVDVACGTGAVALELARRHGCHVLGVDQSPEMLAAGRKRVAAAGLADSVELRVGQAEALPLPDEHAAALTFTYLLRYVDDPAATLRELARVVRPGGVVAGLEFFVPPRAPARAAWELYVRALLPAAGHVVSPAWGEVGGFLGPSIRDFWRRHPLPRLLQLWEGAGLTGVQARALSLGGGIVIWGRRGG